MKRLLYFAFIAMIFSGSLKADNSQSQKHSAVNLTNGRFFGPDSINIYNDLDLNDEHTRFSLFVSYYLASVDFDDGSCQGSARELRDRIHQPEYAYLAEALKLYEREKDILFVTEFDKFMDYDRTVDWKNDVFRVLISRASSIPKNLYSDIFEIKKYYDEDEDEDEDEDMYSIEVEIQFDPETTRLLKSLCFSNNYEARSTAKKLLQKDFINESTKKELEESLIPNDFYKDE